MIRKLFQFDESFTPFQFFSLSHNAALITIILLIGILYLFREPLSKEPLSTRVRLYLVVFLLLFESGLYIWYFAFDQWSVDQTLPFHLCSITYILSMIMLINKNYTLYEFTYFAGLGGAIQALITPAAILSGFPHFTFYYFFVAHGGIVLAALYMTWVHGYRPYFKSIWKTLLMLNGYMVIMVFANKLTDGNYLFIAHKPEKGSLLDFLGPWPWYILSMEAAAVVIFLVLYLPFAVKDWLRRKRN